jgi:hypothetical protein
MPNAQPIPIVKSTNALAFFELIDAVALGQRWNVPTTWIRNHTWSGAEDPIPHIRLGRYVRYRWGHPDLMAWLDRRSIR